MKRLKLAAGAVSFALLTGGCGLMDRGVYDTPLPGGADVGSDPITLSADFDDVVDLVPQSSVKVDNVAVGRVSEIEVNDGGQSARVTLIVNADTDLPAGTTARLRQTSLLGEKYVSLVRPESPVSGPAIVDGTHLPLAATSEVAEVEQVLGALSTVLNGGGIGQFQEISRELQQVSEGRPEEIKAFLNSMETFVTGLDERKDSITAAIDALARLSTTLEADQDKIVNALEGLEPGMQVIVDQREQLVDMLESLDRLSAVTVRTLDRSQEDIVADLKALEPVLTQLAKAGEDLPNALEILLTYPFPDSVLGAIKGDYLNAFIETNFRTLPADCDAIGCEWAQPGSGTAIPGSGGTVNRSPSLLPPTDNPTPGVPSPTVTVPTEDVPTQEPTKPTPSPSDPPPTTGPVPTTVPTDPPEGDDEGGDE